LKLKMDGGESSHVMMAWSQKGDRLALVTEEAVTIFDATSGAPISQIPNATTVIYAAFSPDLDRGVLAGNDGTLALWPPLMQSSGDTAPTSGTPPTYALWASDDRLALWGGLEAQIWDVRKRQIVARFPAAVSGSQAVARGSPDEIAVATPDGEVLLGYRAAPGSPVTTLAGARPPIYAISVQRRSGLAAALGGDSLWTWDISQREPKAPKRFPVSGVELVWTSGHTVLVSGLDGSVTEFDLTVGKPVWHFSPPREPNQSGAAPARLAPDGKSFRAGGAIWQRPIGAPPVRVASFPGDGIFWTPDGAGLLQFSTGTLSLYAASTGKLTTRWKVNRKLSETAWWLAWSADGHRIALVDADGTAYIMRIVDPASGTELR